MDVYLQLFLTLELEGSFTLRLVVELPAWSAFGHYENGAQISIREEAW
jgi:hypothetical protein